MSMTREEASVLLKMMFAFWANTHERTNVEMEMALNLALSALRPVGRERVEKFKEYFDDLYGKGLEVYGWHMNGEAKSFDDFYEDACEYAGL